eukprot:764977-Hanusia_phi.AAC.4
MRWRRSSLSLNFDKDSITGSNDPVALAACRFFCSSSSAFSFSRRAGQQQPRSRGSRSSDEHAQLALSSSHIHSNHEDVGGEEESNPAIESSFLCHVCRSGDVGGPGVSLQWVRGARAGSRAAHRSDLKHGEHRSAHATEELLLRGSARRRVSAREAEAALPVEVGCKDSIAAGHHHEQTEGGHDWPHGLHQPPEDPPEGPQATENSENAEDSDRPEHLQQESATSSPRTRIRSQ